MANTPQQFLKINIRTSGHIFQGRSAFECARILESIAAELREHPNDTGREFDVYNTSGIACGMVRFDHTDSE